MLDRDRTDPHRLDADNDGIACEGLPVRDGSPPLLAFVDIEGDTHAASIGALPEAGITNGFQDGTFRPGQPGPAPRWPRSS